MILFDTRLWHRSGVQFRVREHDKVLRQEEMRRGPLEMKHRMLLTLSYGVGGSRFSRAHEHAMSMRNRLLTDPGLCNLSLGLSTRHARRDQPSQAATSLCVRHTIEEDIRDQRLTRSLGARMRPMHAKYVDAYM